MTHQKFDELVLYWQEALRLGSVHIEAHLVPDEIWADPETDGREFSTAKFMAKILIREQDDERKVEVLIVHELLHVLYYLTGIESPHKELEDSIIVISHALTDLHIETCTPKRGKK
jgi:hypothetical protein